MFCATAAPPRRFEFERDTFAFANELVWEYRVDPVSRKMITRPCSPPNTYTHRCFVLARSTRQFFYHVRFDPTLPVAGEPVYSRIVREVVSRNPRVISPESGRVTVPGYDSLRSFSRAQAAVLKANCGGAWQSYMLRSHWRMILPVPRRHQERMAAQLVRSIASRGAAVVHLFLFPQLSINHGVVVYEAAETETDVRFTAYDPNQSDRPTELKYQRAERTFYFPPNINWGGGKVNVVETYCGWLY